MNGRPVLLSAVVVVGLLGAPGPARAAPEHDDFRNAKVISAPYQEQRDSEATHEPGEPKPSCVPGESPFWADVGTVWFSFTPEVPTSLTTHAPFNEWTALAVAAVYTGSSIDGLEEVACTATQVPAGFVAQPGITYRIQAGTHTGGTFALNIGAIACIEEAETSVVPSSGCFLVTFEGRRVSAGLSNWPVVSEFEVDDGVAIRVRGPLFETAVRAGREGDRFVVDGYGFFVVLVGGGAGVWTDGDSLGAAVFGVVFPLIVIVAGSTDGDGVEVGAVACVAGFWGCIWEAHAGAGKRISGGGGVYVCFSWPLPCPAGIPLP